MSKASFVPVWEMMRLRHGIGLRCIEALPADQLDARPIKDMRTPKELVVHMYSFLRAAPESVVAGSLTVNEEADLRRIQSRADLANYADECWKAADAAFARITDAQMSSMVKAPWGEMKADVMIGSVTEEYLHHRGQLYAYLRQLGVAPPVNWDYEGSAAEYQPKQHA